MVSYLICVKPQETKTSYTYAVIDEIGEQMFPEI